MSKTKTNAFGSFLVAPAVAAAVPAVAEAAIVIKRTVGRPKKVKLPEFQTTTIRMDPADHTAVRTLALRDKVAMNSLIFSALKEYCKKRGVVLSGDYK